MKNICSVCGREIPQDEIFEKIICPNGEEICRCHPCVSSDNASDALAYVLNEVGFLLSSFIENGEISEELANDMLNYMLGGAFDEISMGAFSKKDSEDLAKSVISECKSHFESTNCPSIQESLDIAKEEFESRINTVPDNYTRRDDIDGYKGWRTNLEEERQKGKELFAYTYWYHLLKDKNTGLNNININKEDY